MFRWLAAAFLAFGPAVAAWPAEQRVLEPIESAVVAPVGAPTLAPVAALSALPAAAAAAVPAAAPAQPVPAVSPALHAERTLAAYAQAPDGAALAGSPFDGAKAPDASSEESAEAIFTRAFPRSQAPLLARGQKSDFADLAGMFVVNNVFYQIKAGERPYQHVTGVPSFHPKFNDFKSAAQDVLDFAERADVDPAAAKFVSILAKRQAEQDFAPLREQRFEGHQLPPNPLKGGEYWDLASGPNGAHLMMGRLDPSTTYKFFDYSPYVVDYLNETKSLLAASGEPVDKLEVARADVRQLARPPTPLSVLRVKNVQTYVQGFVPALEKMTDWIADGGALVLQIDKTVGQRQGLIEQLGPLIERLVAEGWTLRFDEGRDARDLESLTLTRTSAGKPDKSSQAQWRRYLKFAEEKAGWPRRRSWF